MTSSEAHPEPTRRVGLPPPPGRMAGVPGTTPASALETPVSAPTGRLFPQGTADTSGRLRPIRERVAPDRSALKTDVRIFGVTFVAVLAVAVFIYYGLDIWNADSLSRTIDAQVVLYSRDPHLGAIGFVWPPLPTLARIALLPITHLANIEDFTGQITSVFFAAGTVVVLHKILSTLGLPALPRALWIIAAMLNPVVVLHFANGTAESAFTMLLLLVLYSAIRLPSAPLSAVSSMGMAIALALLVRYEALAIAGTAGLGVLIYTIAHNRRTSGGNTLSSQYVRSEAVMVALMFPVFFVGIMWLYFNWSIQGDPLFFYRSVYSIRGAADVARNAPGHVLEYAVHSIPGTFSYILERTLQASALFVVATALLAWIALRKRDTIALLLLMVSLSIHAMQAYQAYTGSIAPWLRYWVYLPLLTPILLAYWATRPGWLAALGKGGRELILLVLVPVMLLVSNGIAFVSMQSPAVGYDEQIFSLELAGKSEAADLVRSKIPSKTSAEEIATYLNTTEGTILLDKQRAPLFILSIEDPSRLILDSDRDFQEALQNAPTAADWILLPDPAEDTDAVLAHDSIYLVYPDLYDGAPWLELEHEFTGNKHWRLYRVITPPADAPQ